MWHRKVHIPYQYFYFRLNLSCKRGIPYQYLYFSLTSAANVASPSARLVR